MKYCQGPKCHTYDTTDRKRGPKGNKQNQTRTISTYSYGHESFCTLTCQNDWWSEHGQRAVDHFGRLHNPIILTEENAWARAWNPNRYDDSYNRIDSQPDYIERNMITNAERPLTTEQG